MLASYLILADGITIQPGNNVWTIGANFIMYVIVTTIDEHSFTAIRMAGV
jgi:hypothetical protein